jgi:Tfp pilus assembly protein PilX
MIIMIALGLMGVATLASVMDDQQVSGFQNRGRVAFHAAEAGLAATTANIDGVGVPTVPSASLGDATIYPHGQPAYGPDPTVTPAVEDLGATGADGMNLRIGGGGPRYQVQFWKINVQGTAPGGSMRRIEVATGVLRGN